MGENVETAVSMSSMWVSLDLRGKRPVAFSSVEQDADAAWEFSLCCWKPCDSLAVQAQLAGPCWPRGKHRQPRHVSHESMDVAR